jgi:hypothetical protein
MTCNVPEVIRRLRSEFLQDSTVLRSPKPNAFVERLEQSIRQKCLAPFLVFGQQRSDHLI